MKAESIAEWTGRQIGFGDGFGLRRRSSSTHWTEKWPRFSEKSDAQESWSDWPADERFPEVARSC
jgi:hypothetical protein